VSDSGVPGRWDGVHIPGGREGVHIPGGIPTYIHPQGSIYGGLTPVPHPQGGIYGGLTPVTHTQGGIYGGLTYYTPRETYNPPLAYPGRHITHLWHTLGRGLYTLGYT